jgi:hypothetical protein
VDAGPVDPSVYARLGLGPQSGSDVKASGVSPQANIPVNMGAGAAFSAAIATNVAKFNEMDTLGDWDGKEDDTADHGGKVMDATSVPAAASSNPNSGQGNLVYAAVARSLNSADSAADQATSWYARVHR